MTLSAGWADVGADDLLVDDSLFQMSIEDLMELKITSVSKKAEKLSDAAAAVFVITNDDIRRSGATSVPEVLRMVPGLQVARIDANKWVVTSRGFSGFFSNKLLVLIDGRSVYTPLYSGVFWDVQDLPLQDVERIEVIRGPGATLWGANAVNGVINILTKKAQDTQGFLMEAGVGTEEQGFGTIRYGGKRDDQTHYRFYSKYLNRDDGVYNNGKEGHDDWRILRAGFRLDRDFDNDDSTTVQGDIYCGEVGWTVTTAALSPPYSRIQNDDDHVFGGNILFRWESMLSNTSEMTLQVYYDCTERDNPLIEEWRDTVDIDFNHRFSLNKYNKIIWGIGYRYTRDDIENSFRACFEDDNRSNELFSGFIQDDVTLEAIPVRLTLGSKFEYNDYTGFEIQPNIRLLCKLDNNQSVWASISRSVRTPSRIEDDARLNQMVIPPNSLGQSSPPILVSFFGTKELDSEKLYAFEIGYRTLVTDSISVDMTAFYNDYERLLTLEPTTPFAEDFPLPFHLVVPYLAGNKMDGNTYGAEMAAEWRCSDRVSLKISYTFFKMDLTFDADRPNTFSLYDEDDAPRHQISLRQSINFSKKVELDIWPRYVDNIPSRDVDSYVSLDVRAAWKPREHIEFTLVGQNLLDDQRMQFDKNSTSNFEMTEVERSVYGKVTFLY